MGFYIDFLASTIALFFNFTQALSEKRKLYLNVIFFLVTLLTSYAVYSYNPAYHTYCILSWCALFTLITTKNRLINLIFTFLSYFISVVFNNLMCLTIQLVLGITIEKLLSNIYYQIPFYLIFLIGTFLISSLLGKLSIWLSRSYIVNSSKQTLFLVALEVLICVVIVSFNITYGRQIGYPRETIVFNCILFFIYFVLSTLLLVNSVKTTRKNLLMQHQLEQTKILQQYTEHIEASASQLREFKHDYINLLLTLDELIQKTGNLELIDFYNKSIKPTRTFVSTKELQLVSLSNISDKALKSLLYNKLNYAASKGIDVGLTLNEEIPDLTLDVMESSTVIGILLDNAIEATLSTDKPKLNVSFSTDGKTLNIDISNSFSGKLPSLSQMLEEGFTTKENHSGLGLHKISKIISKHPEINLDINQDNNLVTFTISSYIV